jgi:hypothetical protein
MNLICFRKKSCVSILPNLTLCYSTTTFYRLPVPTGVFMFLIEDLNRGKNI